MSVVEAAVHLLRGKTEHPQEIAENGFLLAARVLSSYELGLFALGIVCVRLCPGQEVSAGAYQDREGDLGHQVRYL